MRRPLGRANPAPRGARVSRARRSGYVPPVARAEQRGGPVVPLPRRRPAANHRRRRCRPPPVASSPGASGAPAVVPVNTGPRGTTELVNQPDPYGAAVASVRELCKSLAPSSIPLASATLAAAPPPSRRRARSSLIDLLVDGSNSAAVQQQSPSSMAFAELEAFLQLAEINQKQQPQHVWRGYKEQFPVLYLVACCSIGAVASSAASERDFPTAGAVMRKNSTRLLPQQLEMQCFMHDNVDLLPKPIEAVPAMTNQQANQVRAAMPMAGRQQDLEDDINTSADEE